MLITFRSKRVQSLRKFGCCSLFCTFSWKDDTIIFSRSTCFSFSESNHQCRVMQDIFELFLRAEKKVEYLYYLLLLFTSHCCTDSRFVGTANLNSCLLVIAQKWLPFVIFFAHLQKLLNFTFNKCL